MPHLNETLDFVRSLGVKVVQIKPDGTCATWDDDNRLRLCSNLCPGQTRKVMDKVLKRL